MTTKKTKIEENIKQMSLNIEEWKAVEITKTYREPGTQTIHPYYNLEVTLKGFTKPNTLYKTKNIEFEKRCELCGSLLKVHYLITNLEKKQYLLVGSTCVKHFSSKTGSRMLQQRIRKEEETTVQKTIEDFYSRFMYINNHVHYYRLANKTHDLIRKLYGANFNNKKILSMSFKRQKDLISNEEFVTLHKEYKEFLKNDWQYKFKSYF
jgi:predicted membrane-bound dolichyl-phosphate-mannose-protein mannosyltransferase